MLRQLPGGCSSVAGATSMQEAENARLVGANVVLVKQEWLAAEFAGELGALSGGEADHRTKRQAEAKIARFVSDLQYTVSGDA